MPSVGVVPLVAGFGLVPRVHVVPFMGIVLCVFAVVGMVG
jgi:hypothetical protein